MKPGYLAMVVVLVCSAPSTKTAAQQINVSASTNWTKTKVVLKAGDLVTIKAGSVVDIWTRDGYGCKPDQGPNGYTQTKDKPGKCVKNCGYTSGGQYVCWPAFNTRLYGLSGKVGDHCFSVGKSFGPKTIPACGEVELTLNDSLKTDNCGSFKATITVKSTCTPQPEICNNGVDDDCDCKTDEEECKVIKICGNGALDTGEKCDPGITSGAGRCKTLADCDDKDACTVDTLAGSQCNVKCNNTPVKAQVRHEDGCCPPGMTLQQDADCLPPCGPDKTKNCVSVGIDGGTGATHEGDGGEGMSGGGAVGMGCTCRTASGSWAGLGSLALLALLARVFRRRRS